MTSAPPAGARATERLAVAKHGALFACSDNAGDIVPGSQAGAGLWHGDTRHLSALRFECSPSSPDVRVLRARALDDGMTERLRLVNHGATATFELRLHVAADFADMFDARGLLTRRRPAPALSTSGGVIRFAYEGSDGVAYATTVRLSPPPHSIYLRHDGATAFWRADLHMDGELAIVARVEVEPVPRPPAPLRLGGTRPDGRLGSAMSASAADLVLLWTPHAGGAYIAAGIPYYVAPFGRDAIITSLQTLRVAPAIARSTLLLLAAYQAGEDDPERDAEPGKIFHELRSGELARAGAIPQRPYYGSVDATPLWLCLAGAYLRATSDQETVLALKDNVAAALAWMAERADCDGDGLIEYARRSPDGLVNHGWKDSPDAIVHPDATIAAGPIALVEAQAYAYAALRHAAFLYRGVFAQPREAARLQQRAVALRMAFDEAFWMPDEGCYALALDGDKRQVRSVASNAGHALAGGIALKERAASVAARLMEPDMFSGWGVRTLTAGSRAYDPASYHRGSVWPHDTLICAAGFARYGLDGHAATLKDALLDALHASEDKRLPELFCGNCRTEGVPYVPYSGACAPQAWAAGVPFGIAGWLGPGGAGPQPGLWGGTRSGSTS